MALPGALPVFNRAVAEKAVMFGLAVVAQINQTSVFARKNYFYPDLPMYYQISQFDQTMLDGGEIVFSLEDHTHRIPLTRAHLEEDAGKSLHENFTGPHGESSSGIDLNRAGTPLLEIVSEPDMRSAAQAAAFARTLHGLEIGRASCRDREEIGVGA